MEVAIKEEPALEIDNFVVNQSTRSNDFSNLGECSTSYASNLYDDPVQEMQRLLAEWDLEILTDRFSTHLIDASVLDYIVDVDIIDLCKDLPIRYRLVLRHKLKEKRMKSPQDENCDPNVFHESPPPKRKKAIPRVVIENERSHIRPAGTEHTATSESRKSATVPSAQSTPLVVIPGPSPAPSKPVEVRPDVNIASKKQPPATRGRNWTVIEDEILCRAWLSIYQESLPKGDRTLYQRIFDEYLGKCRESQQVCNPEHRQATGVKSRWLQLSKACAQFFCWSKLQKRKSSDEFGSIEQTLALYRKLTKSSFLVMHAYQILENSPKWKRYIEKVIKCSERFQLKSSDIENDDTGDESSFSMSEDYQITERLNSGDVGCDEINAIDIKEEPSLELTEDPEEPKSGAEPTHEHAHLKV
ncbi:uncharacterized protein LOC129743727 isoform X4 [Uranotaenia lowii]|uniref:uncharacterized protein LOC129743727 isoform X4 n=1 Tax=Uranotaenia lowii TaxID=190385 RepID=UPI00247A1AFE|nr:uncharacterized protein LOC129743727 isoform X4 [Uranotaenia lowii]